jgi:hypothetical protein
MRILFENLLLNKFIMSRRTAPTAGRQQQQQRLPQPSIKSSHAFAPQPSSNLNQYQQMNAKKQLQQQQLQQPQQYQQPGQLKNYQPEYQEEYNEKEQLGNITKMTVAQAITLITLRLGSIETKLQSNDVLFSGENINSESLVNISDRLDVLETKMNLSSSTDYKQQIDHLTQAIIQSKNLSNSLVKENKELKIQLTTLKKEMIDCKELIEMIRNMTISNENKIFQMLNTSSDLQMEDQIEIKFDSETDMNLSDSEHGIIETDIKKTFEYDNDDELQMTDIENVESK